MPCFSPLDAWRPKSGTQLIFSYSAGKCSGITPDLKVPCGQCIGCRLERSRQWAVRCMHEAKMHDRNCFITLTYDNAHLPADRSLNYRDFQLFMKRLRKYIRGVDEAAAKLMDLPVKYTSVRFYMCGEYGEKLGRPHFHACIFGYDFSDKKLWSVTEAGSNLFRSELLESLWPYGFSSIGDVTFESAAYVARYIMKKVNGEAAESHYTFRRFFNRGDIRAPARVYSDVFKAGNRLYLAG